MIVRYYKNEELSYTNRKRYSSTRLADFQYSQEEQRSVLLGDGATTSLKTAVDNICNYVTIDNTRWYVTSHTYINGGQVVLNLQRDVIGENGLTGMFGKVQRGYTNTKLRNRRELSLNQVLQKRIPMLDDGNKGYIQLYTNEYKNIPLWGIMYFSKKTGEDTVTIDIPGITISTVDYPFINDNTVYEPTIEYFSNVYVDFHLQVLNTLENKARATFECRISFNLTAQKQWEYSVTAVQTKSETSLDYSVFATPYLGLGGSNEYSSAITALENIASSMLNNPSPAGIRLPEIPSFDDKTNKNYDGICVKQDNVYYKYTISNEKTKSNNGGYDRVKIRDTIRQFTDNNRLSLNDTGLLRDVQPNITFTAGASFRSFTRQQLSPSEAGQLSFSVSANLIDEPYTILVCPLFTGTYFVGSGDYDIEKDACFNVFNQIIQGTSGDNGLLVDAQIYPYCPDIAGQVATINKVPIFSIFSNSYERRYTITPEPYTDVKKDYVQRVYSIRSPEQSGKFDFNFYDYTNDNVANKSLTFIIKTALKPFSLLSCCVPIPETNAIIGMTYESDLRGCSPSGNGFECSLSSNAFETYRRQNSNYQQIFALQQGELRTSHEVERVNEKTQAVVNTITQTAMGALGGHSIGGKIGAAVGGAAAGLTVGVANAIQYEQNEKLREYEEYLQQQSFDLQIGTIKNLPNTINRISSFNEIILKNFYYVLEVYDCTDAEKQIVDTYLNMYGYELGVIDFFSNYYRQGWYLKGSLMKSSLPINQNQIAARELNGGIYYYE